MDAPELIKRAQVLREDAKRPIALLLTKEVLGRRAAFSRCEYVVTTMKRFDCLKALVAVIKDALVVSSAGAMTLEWNAFIQATATFACAPWGCVFDRSRHGAGVAAAQGHRARRRWLVFDESLFAADDRADGPDNLVHIVFDNEVYEASGAKNRHRCGHRSRRYRARGRNRNSLWAKSFEEFAEAAATALPGDELSFIGAKVTTERTAVPRILSTRLRISIALSATSKKPNRSRSSRQSAGELHLIGFCHPHYEDRY